MQKKFCTACVKNRSMHSIYAKDKFSNSNFVDKCRQCAILKRYKTDKEYREEVKARRRFYYYGYKASTAYKSSINKRVNKKKNTRSTIVSHYGAICTCCNESNPLFLVVFSPAGLSYSKIIAQNYPQDIKILCYNCLMVRKRNHGTCPHQVTHQPYDLSTTLPHPDIDSVTQQAV